MSKRLITLLFAFSVALHALAQDETKLTIPSTPAFSILNYEPTSVMKPTSNKDLAADVLNSFDKDGKLLMNLGLEVSPYWLKSRPLLTREKYLLSRDFTQTLLQSFSLSAATTKDSSSGNNKLGTGLRFKVFNGEPVKEYITAEKEFLKTGNITLAITNEMQLGSPATKEEAIDAIVKELADPRYELQQSRIKNVRKAANVIKPKYADTKEDIKSFLMELNDLVQEADSMSVKNLVANMVRRKGLIVELAGATAFNMSDKNDLERAGGWLNISNYVSATDLFTFTARVMGQNKDTIMLNYDAGLSFLKKGDRYNVSLEAMARWYSMEYPLGPNIVWKENDFTYRLAFQGSYLISRELSVNLSFGKDFSNTSVTGSGYFSILGLNYSIFNKI